MAAWPLHAWRVTPCLLPRHAAGAAVVPARRGPPLLPHTVGLSRAAAGAAQPRPAGPCAGPGQVRCGGWGFPLRGRFGCPLHCCCRPGRDLRPADWCLHAAHALPACCGLCSPPQHAALPLLASGVPAAGAAGRRRRAAAAVPQVRPLGRFCWPAGWAVPLPGPATHTHTGASAPCRPSGPPAQVVPRRGAAGLPAPLCLRPLAHGGRGGGGLDGAAAGLAAHPRAGRRRQHAAGLPGLFTSGGSRGSRRRGQRAAAAAAAGAACTRTERRRPRRRRERGR